MNNGKTDILTHQGNCLVSYQAEKVNFKVHNGPRKSPAETAPQMISTNQIQPALQPTYLFSAAATFMVSIMFFTVSIICLALIVCCSNLVFTADCEIHSCEGPKPQHITAIPCQHNQEFHCQKAHAANFTMNLNQ